MCAVSGSGVLDTGSNVQFEKAEPVLFSDGKLNTLVKKTVLDEAVMS